MISCLEKLTNDDVQVRPEEAGIVLFVFGIWLAAIALFFNRSSNFWVLNSFGTIVLAGIDHVANTHGVQVGQNKTARPLHPIHACAST